MKNKILILLSFILFFKIGSAQYHYAKLIEKGKYGKTYKKTVKRYKKHKNDISVNYDLAYIFSIQDFKKFNIDTAYYYANKSLILYEDLSINERDKLKKSNINKNTINKQIIKICNLAFNIQKQKNTIDAYDYFINHYTYSKELHNKAIENRNQLAFNDALKTNTVKSFQYFIDKYPDASEITEAKKKRKNLAFLKVKTKNTVDAWQTFINTYPNASEISEAKKLRDQILFNKATAKNKSSAFDNFLKNYPNSFFYDKAQFKRDRVLGSFFWTS